MEHDLHPRCSMKSASTRLFVAMAFVLPLACGGDDDNDNDDLDQRQAKESWSAASHSAASAHSDFAANVVLGEQGDISVACQGGGLLHVTGTMDEANQFDLDISYEDCIDNGVMINGDVSIVAVVDVDVDIDDDDNEDDSVQAHVIVDYDGLLELDGDVEGTCIVDAEVRAGAVIFDHYAGAGVTIEGTICGHEASDVVRDQ